MANSPTSTRPLVVILLGVPFSPQNYERTGIPYLTEELDVVVFDCIPWLRNNYLRFDFQKHKYPHIITINNSAEFEAAASRLKPSYAIDFLGYGGSTHWIQKTLRKYGTKFVIRSLGPIPDPFFRSTRTKDYLSMAMSNPFVFLTKAIKKLYVKTLGEQLLAADVSLLAGRKSLNAYTRRSKDILWLPSLDYYTYRAVQERSEQQGLDLPVQGKFTLFIDTCLASAIDYTVIGYSPPVEPDKYHALLRNMFVELENLTGWPVVIAAHPNGKDIANYASLFGERQVFFELTAELCSQSDLVCTDGSTALSYAVLWNKPLIILTSHLLNKTLQGALARAMSAELDCPLLHLEFDNDCASACNRARDISTKSYKQYIENFIKSNDVVEDTPWQAFTNLVKQGS